MKKYILMFGLTLVMGLFISNTVVAQWTQGSGVVYLNNLSDKVGVGLNNPAVKFQVDGGTAISDIWATKSVSAADGQVGRFRIRNDFNNTIFNLALRRVGGKDEMLQSVNDGSQWLEFVYVNLTDKVYEMRSGIETALFNPSGSVGIGVDLADMAKLSGAKLGVNGKIVSTEVEVKLYGSWPDFVFQDDFNLMPLNELESFIATNRHLPGVPTEAEVTESGVNLGEMTGILLQKVEEMTLHIIELNKRIEELEGR